MAASKILFTGRVQGVGFRQTTVQLSRHLDLAGTVRNLSDGRVELIVSGADTQIQTLLDRLAEHFEGSIRNVERQPAASDSTIGPGIRVTS